MSLVKALLNYPIQFGSKREKKNMMNADRLIANLKKHKRLIQYLVSEVEAQTRLDENTSQLFDVVTKLVEKDFKNSV